MKKRLCEVRTYPIRAGPFCEARAFGLLINFAVKVRRGGRFVELAFNPNTTRRTPTLRRRASRA